ncbi:hypothetical protein BgiMline_025436, partial [Biomphalaria glabrata]
FQVKVKGILLLVLLASCYSFLDAAPCLHGPVCANHEVVARENGQTYCCQSGYKTIVTKLHSVDGFITVECTCHLASRKLSSPNSPGSGWMLTDGI